MSAREWEAITELFHAALDQPVPQRDTFLENACAGDTALLASVRRLLAAHETASGFLGTPAIADALAVLDASESTPVGTLIGPYRIVREIGRGGMGAVYLAERADDQFTKQVAIKLIKRGMDTDGVLRRFRDERQILADLEHPNVARLLDGGTTTDGRPYFVMEYVDGRPIDRYCAGRAIGIADRLRLFLLVCGAVSYAHQRLVVHRDIKPSNVLVTEDGTPKLLDFGIAKLMRPGTSDAPDTLSAVSAMTPEYASPEQLRSQRVDAISDMYSLGALLYELLAGRPPYVFTSRAPGEVAAVIEATDPMAPSAVAGERIRRQLRGDIDTIVLKAIACARERRYQSVEQLAEDLRCHLEGRPIAARKDAAMYRAAKFVRRNAVAVAAAVLVAATLVGGIAATTWQAVKARRESQRADAQAAAARAVTEFLQNDLLAQAAARAQAGAGATADPNLTVRTALDRASDRVAGRFANEPLIESAIRYTIGVTYSDLGLLAQSQPHLERALELRRRTLGPADPETLKTARRLGWVLHLEGHNQAAEPILTDVLAQQQRQSGPNNGEVAETLNMLASTLSSSGRRREATDVMVRVVEIERQLYGAEHPETLIAMNNLAVTYSNEGRYGEAEAIGKSLVEIKRRTLGSDDPSTLMSMNNLALAYRNQGKFADAEALVTETLERRRRVTGPDSPDTLQTMNTLGNVYAAEGRYAEAEPLLVQAIEGRTRLYGDRNPDTVAAMNNLADVYRREGNLEKAKTLFGRVLETRRQVLGPNHPNTLSVVVSLGAIELEQHEPAKAEELLRQAVDGYTQTKSDSWQRYYAQSLLGQSLAARGRYADAEPLLAEGYEGMTRRQQSISV
jgi:tetratricopeptide (TPR) repeat protein/tRNA A-37 threonylcarbamoyl transferase component Bud32